jgi:predicted phosphodiesterase
VTKRPTASELLAAQVPQNPKAAFQRELEAAKAARERFMRLRLGQSVPPPEPYPHRRKPELGPTHLVIGDAHARPSADNYRFELLGRMVADLQPDTVVDIGDWFSMDSLCKYDVGLRCFEGRRYWRDIEVGIDAQERFRAAMGPPKRNKWKPRLVRCLGNHENRINAATEKDSKLTGVIGTDDLLSREFGWEEHRFLHPVTIDGITYTHYPDKGGRGPGAATKHLAANALTGHRSIVWGHTHRFDYFEEPRGEGKIMAINCGAFFDEFEDMRDQYAQNDVWRWKLGVLVLWNVREGVGDLDWWSMDRIKGRYA